MFSNTILSYNYFISFDERSFIILAFTSGLFLLALIVLSDFDNLFLASRTIDVLRALPVNGSDIFKAKFMSAIIFLLLFILSTAVPQVIFFYFIEENIYKSVLFVLSDLMFVYFSIAVLVLIYIFAIKYFKEKATLVLNFLQILFFLFIFYSSTLSSRVASQPKEFFVKENLLNHSIVKYLPQTFFSNSVYSTAYFIICLVITITMFAFLYFIISKNYYEMSDRVRALSSGRTTSKRKLEFTFLKNFINRFILSNNYERASFSLVKYQLQNSKFLKVKYIPIILMPLLFVMIGLISGSRKILFFNENAGANHFFKTLMPIFSPSIAFTLIMCSRLLISNTKISDENTTATEWIYDSLPVKEKRYIIKGANKFIYSVFIFPVVVLITILLCFKADTSVVLYNIIFIFSGMYFISSVSLLFDKTYPFTLESTKFNSASKFIEIFFAMFLGALLFLIQIFVFQNTIFVIIAILFFVAVSLLLNRN